MKELKTQESIPVIEQWTLQQIKTTKFKKELLGCLCDAWGWWLDWWWGGWGWWWCEWWFRLSIKLLISRILDSWQITWEDMTRDEHFIDEVLWHYWC